jgi:membrane protease YdiL (CAAX protease family)
MRSDTVALALTALPVLLTTALLRLTAGLSRHLPSPYSDFAAYAVANWLTFALILRIVGHRRLRDRGLTIRVTSRSVGAALLGFIIGVIIYAAVSALLARFGLPPVRGMRFTAPTGFEMIVLFLCVVISAAFCEEVFFRVLWVGVLRTRVPTWLAGATSIAAFAAIHYPYFGVGGVIFISVWAIVPVSLFIVSGDVTAPLLMHALNNAFAYIVVPVIFSAGQ